MSKPSLVSIVAVDGRDDSALLALAASVASGLDTGIASAIVDSANEREIQIRPVDEFHRTTATGVAATVDGHTVVFGNAALFADLGLSVENLGDSPERLQRRGEQVLFVAVDGRTAGFLGVAAADVNRTLTNVMEDEMKDLATTADQFTNDVTDLPTSGTAELIELANGDRFELRIAPVTKRLGDA